VATPFTKRHPVRTPSQPRDYRPVPLSIPAPRGRLCSGDHPADGGVLLREARCHRESASTLTLPLHNEKNHRRPGPRDAAPSPGSGHQQPGSASGCSSPGTWASGTRYTGAPVAAALSDHQRVRTLGQHGAVLPGPLSIPTPRRRLREATGEVAATAPSPSCCCYTRRSTQHRACAAGAGVAGPGP